MIPMVDLRELDFAELDGKKLNVLLNRARITGAEPIDYPVTDGVVLYIQDPQKRKAVLVIEQDPTEDRFSVKIARLP